MNKGIYNNACAIGDDTLPCFNLLTNEEKVLLDANTVRVSYNKGETICKQGSFASHIMVIHNGLAKVFIEGCNETLIIKILPAVNFIGLSSLYEGNTIFPCSAKAYLVTEVDLIEINTFKKLISSNAKFAYQIISQLSEKTVTTYGRFFCLTKKQTNGRLADLLLCLAQRVYKRTTFPMHLTRKELAELAGMSVESTTRILTYFKEEGLITMNSKNIELNDPERLMLISEKG
jgi:CRP/FNR family transcriptional regulator